MNLQNLLKLMMIISIVLLIVQPAFSGNNEGRFLEGSWFFLANVTSFEGAPPLPFHCTYTSDLLGGGVQGSIVCTQPRLSPEGVPIGEMNRHGEWIRVGESEFAVTLVGLALDPDQKPFGTIKSTGVLTVSDDLKTLSGTSTTLISDFEGNVIFATEETLSGSRIGAQIE